jgi:hypothetical protein
MEPPQNFPGSWQECHWLQIEHRGVTGEFRALHEAGYVLRTPGKAAQIRDGANCRDTIGC